ncbi:neuroendocrine convertase 1-like [Ischnura elegans]|uniref:neuroendocrine convertase 1-like n=1 Tax=Ischnura elegans TaxID=197161 RepID=UPI001ED88B89|nr:neuroendocrine convertase 1-like [Ischnura elegans]
MADVENAFRLSFTVLMFAAGSLSLPADSHAVPVWDKHYGRESSDRFTNEWIAKINGGDDVAADIASSLGYKFLGQIPGFPGIYRMLKDDFPRVGKRGEPHLTQKLIKDDRVMWAEQQFAKQRDKRGYIPLSSFGAYDSTSSKESQENILEKEKTRNLFNDELWAQQWYLQDTRTEYDKPKMDLHVIGVYNKGITGRNVRVCVLDDGIETDHPDIRRNFDPEISADVNDEDYDPSPHYNTNNTNSHGTRCAGEIAMVANNKLCGVGVAFNAKIGGVRMLDGMVSDLTEGLALGWAQDKVDIYSASWGPRDDGKTVEGPGRLGYEALLNGITHGRGGKGSIFVWASGNGGSKGDDCSCDGYAASPYTLSVGSASQSGQFPWYGEKCPSTLAATYSSGEFMDQMITTTDLHGKCTTKHTGTSAAAPLAAGIIALALEINPSLTWRDVQHLVVWTSQPSPLAHNIGWMKNGAGLLVNPRFGYGLMDALSLVTAAEHWVSVPPQAICLVQAERSSNTILTSKTPVELVFYSTGCRKADHESSDYFSRDTSINEEGDEINYLEHIELEASIKYSVRGALQIYLSSPSGTTAQLLKVRPADDSQDGFERWRFMSVLTWGENPTGKWTLLIEDPTNSLTNFGMVGSSPILWLRGTKEMPNHMKSGPRKYDEQYNRVHKNMERYVGGTI